MLANWNKYLIFQDFLKRFEHFLYVLVASHFIDKCRDLKEFLQTCIPQVWQQAITERTQVELISQQAAGQGDGKGRASGLSRTQAFQHAGLVSQGN